VDDTLAARDLLERADGVQGLKALAESLIGSADARPSEPTLASAVDFILEGLYAQKKIGRTDDWSYQAGETPRRQPRPVDSMMDRETPPTGKKRYYN
jgi:magnesium chelatase subunit I